MSLLDGARLVAVDTETTGFDADRDALLEVACVALENGTIGETWARFVRPVGAKSAVRAIAPGATRVHGITDEMVAAAQYPREVGDALAERCANATLVFHNAAFDLAFLAKLIKAAGRPPLANPVVDTLGLARGLWPGAEASLGALARRVELPYETAHRAAGDALTTARLFLVLAERWERERGITSLAELAAASQDVVRASRRRAPAPAVPAGAR
jgi:DNA polymerase III epsilon subunit family exonuclease